MKRTNDLSLKLLYKGIIPIQNKEIALFGDMPLKNYFSTFKIGSERNTLEIRCNCCRWGACWC